MIDINFENEACFKCNFDCFFFSQAHYDHLIDQFILKNWEIDIGTVTPTSLLYEAYTIYLGLFDNLEIRCHPLPPGTRLQLVFAVST